VNLITELFMKAFSMIFTDHGAFELAETAFIYPLHHVPIRSVRGIALEGPHVRTFAWSRGVKALCILFLKSAGRLRSVGASDTFSPFILVGGAGSPAASLDDAIAKMPNWLMDMFGMTAKGDPIVKRLIIRNNPQRKRSGPVKLALRNQDDLQINVFVNGAPLLEPTAITKLADAIERDWWAPRSAAGMATEGQFVEAREEGLLIPQAAA
jgi:hypothetical protein